MLASSLLLVPPFCGMTVSEISVEKVVSVQSCDDKLSRHFSVKKKAHERPYTAT
jgi:hypothetical protein